LNFGIAKLVIELETTEALLDRAALDWAENTDPANVGRLLVRVFAAKYRAVESSWRAVGMVMEVAGGFGIFRAAALERSSGTPGSPESILRIAL
jgi:alkylation response protein AidB-like acyl-CoA dehydrogenase